jgi:hypothetical protein
MASQWQHIFGGDTPGPGWLNRLIVCNLRCSIPADSGEKWEDGVK